MLYSNKELPNSQMAQLNQVPYQNLKPHRRYQPPQKARLQTTLETWPRPNKCKLRRASASKWMDSHQPLLLRTISWDNLSLCLQLRVMSPGSQTQAIYQVNQPSQPTSQTRAVWIIRMPIATMLSRCHIMHMRLVRVIGNHWISIPIRISIRVSQTQSSNPATIHQ